MRGATSSKSSRCSDPQKASQSARIPPQRQTARAVVRTAVPKALAIGARTRRQDQCELATSVTNGACVTKSALIPYTQHLTLFMLLKYIMHMS